MTKSKKSSNEALVETLVGVFRVTKVVTGGRRFAFSACVVVGDNEGKVGCGHGKAKEVTEARAKASKAAKKNMIKIPLYNGATLEHDVYGKSGAAKVILRKASPGTGIIAGGPMRAILIAAGFQDVVAKSLGSSNTYSMLNATLNALQKLFTRKLIAERRGIPIGEVSTRSKATIQKLQ